MGARWPDSTQVLRAIEIYLQHAYLGEPSPAALSVVRTLRAFSGPFFHAPVFARSPRRCSLRLGNRFYPHMKLVLELEPDKKHYHFRADTHDRHIDLPAAHPEYAAFAELRAKNARISEEIAQAWASEGLPVGGETPER